MLGRADEVMVNLAEGNSPARKVYRRAGFTRHSRFPFFKGQRISPG